MKSGLKARIEERRERNRRLAIADAKNRCGACKRALPETGIRIRFGDDRRYCSDDCVADIKEREA